MQDPTEVDIYLRDVLKATGTLIHGEGDINHVEAELHRKWREEKDSGIPSEIGFNQKTFEVAKRLFIESELYEDLNAIGMGATVGPSFLNFGGRTKQSKAGLTMDHKKEFVNQFIDIKKDDLINNGAIYANLDIVGVKSLGEHRALADNDMTIYNALKENRMKEAQILDYLDD